MSHPVYGYAGSGTLSPTQLFGQYQIERKLGEGAVATVYSAHMQDGRQVALKILTPAAASQRKIRQLFRHEYIILARLHHPGIVAVYEYGEALGRPYIAMALVTGTTLEDFLVSNKKPGETAALTIGWEVATILDYIHTQGIVHRDLKPSNLLITQDRRVLLFDFGTAIEIEIDSASTDDGIYGTPAFLAPEQIDPNQSVDGRADLYALGIILYRMITGRKPFYGSRLEVLEAHLHKPPPKPSDFGYISPQAEAVIMKVLAKNPDERFQTGAEFAEALAMAKRAEPTPESTVSPNHTSSNRITLSKRIVRWLRGGTENSDVDE